MLKVGRPCPKNIPITSKFGDVTPGYRDDEPHKGTDFGGDKFPVMACADGYIFIIRSEREGGERDRRLGKRIWLRFIDESGEYKAGYAHLSEIRCVTGPVEKGTIIGISGATGVVTGPHLHFEVRNLNTNLPVEVEFEDEVKNA